MGLGLFNALLTLLEQIILPVYYNSTNATEPDSNAAQNDSGTSTLNSAHYPLLAGYNQKAKLEMQSLCIDQTTPRRHIPQIRCAL